MDTLPPELVLVTNWGLVMVKYAIVGKFCEGFIEALKIWLHLDEKFEPATRDWAYPLLSLGVVSVSVVGLHLIAGTAWTTELTREVIMGTLATWAALVGLIHRSNVLADRASGRVKPTGIDNPSVT